GEAVVRGRGRGLAGQRHGRIGLQVEVFERRVVTVVMLEYRRAEHIGDQQPGQRFQAVPMGALVAVGGIGAEGDQRYPGVVAGAHGRFRVAVIIAEQVTAYRNLVTLTQAQQVATRVVIVGAAGVLHAQGHRVLGGGLAGGDRGDIHPDKFADIPGQRAGGAGAGFLGDGEQRVAVHRQGATTVDYILD